MSHSNSEKLPQTPSIRINRIEQALAAVCIAYVLVFGLVYLTDPMAQSPQLDARENLVLAHEIDQGLLEESPFYRAMVYPYVLSLMEPIQWRTTLGLIMGLAWHLLAGWLVLLITRQVWNRPWAGTVASCLYLVNPASLFFAVQLLDVTMATALFLGGLWIGIRPVQRWWTVLSCGILLGLAALTRPHFLPVALVTPVAIILLRRDVSQKPLLALIPVFLMLLLYGFINQSHSGEFRVLPWQGAYNLWAANKPGANGLYFKQSVDLSQRGDASNPTRVESIYLYGQAHPEQAPPYSIDAMNDYWRGQFLDHLRNSPLEVARLWVFKAYAVVNSYEQYNNITFSFHKQRLPLLKWNPLNWGILFILGSLGLVQLWRADPRKAATWLLLMLAYASMLILFYASARFRLPLVPLMAVLAGGVPAGAIQTAGKATRTIAMITVTVFAGLITFSAYSGIRETDTYVQDRLLLANAHTEVGNDLEAARWAREVLKEFPDRNEAVRIYMISYFNLALLDQNPESTFGDWDAQKAWVKERLAQDPIQNAILGVYLWNWGQEERAVSLWNQLENSTTDENSLSQAALVAVGEIKLPVVDSPLASALRKILIPN